MSDKSSNSQIDRKGIIDGYDFGIARNNPDFLEHPALLIDLDEDEEPFPIPKSERQLQAMVKFTHGIYLKLRKPDHQFYIGLYGRSNSSWIDSCFNIDE